MLWESSLQAWVGSDTDTDTARQAQTGEERPGLAWHQMPKSLIRLLLLPVLHDTPYEGRVIS